jgi:molecular chaperone GrpE
MDEQDDVVIEPDNGSEEIEGGGEQKLAKLREDLATTRKEKQEYMDGWQRAKADYVNLLKRFETEAKTLELKGKIGAVETLLPAYDALERAKEHGEIPEDFQAIAKQLESAFASLGLEAVGKVGDQFNPALHEAFGQDTTDDRSKDDTVTALLERGWKIGENIIRAAKVRIAHFTSEK